MSCAGVCASHWADTNQGSSASVAARPHICTGTSLAESCDVPMRHVLAVLVPLLCAACGSDTPTSPTASTSTTTSVAPATIDESYNSTLPIVGSKFYSFPV